MKEKYNYTSKAYGTLKNEMKINAFIMQILWRVIKAKEDFVLLSMKFKHKLIWKIIFFQRGTVSVFCVAYLPSLIKALKLG